MLTWLGGVPTLAGEYLPWQGYLPWVTPPICTWLRYPPPSGPGRGTPHSGVNRLKTLPSPILRMRSAITSMILVNSEFTVVP